MKKEKLRRKKVKYGDFKGLKVQTFKQWTSDNGQMTVDNYSKFTIQY